MIAVLAFHATLAVVAPALGPRLGRRVFLVVALAPLAMVVWTAAQFPQTLDGEVVSEQIEWVPSLGLDLTLRLDAFATLMVALISGIGLFIFVYCASYFYERPGLGRFASTLTWFSGAMLGLVLADNVFALYVFWELTSVASYLLIGTEDEKGSARAAARQALLITTAGGLMLLGGLVLLSQAAGTSSLSEILADPPTGGAVTAALLLMLFGAFTKSAQVPFHSWLPAAMAAPTPVSAYLHSATMVTAGVYLIARFAPAFAVVEGWWRPVVITVGLLTMLLGGWRALRQHDLKLLLAYSTISQLGFLVVLFGTGEPEATVAGATLLLAHGLFKATLFLVVGIVDHQAHTRDVRVLSGLGRHWPATLAVATLAAASMAGVPPLLGFIAKEEAYSAFLHSHLGAGGVIALIGIVAASVLTFAYSARFLWGAFAEKARSTGVDLVGARVPPPSYGFLAPAALLATAGLVFGVAPGLVSPLVVDAAETLDPLVDVSGLALIHGLNGALVLSALTIVAGALLAFQRRAVERAQARMPSVPSTDAAYRRTLEDLNRIADRVTGAVQSGSLPVYLGVILLTVLALPGTALVVDGVWPADIRLAASGVQAGAVAIVTIAAIGTALVERRLAAVLLLGAVGYGVALLFVVQGGPDLAITQLLIETLAVVIFVLVLRHLPEHFPRSPWRAATVLRVVVSLGVGVMAFAFTLVAAGVRSVRPVSDVFIADAVPKAGGRNVVNVILVDFRGFDTLGEITVLLVAGLGIASLVAAGRRREQSDTDVHS